MTTPSVNDVHVGATQMTAPKKLSMTELKVVLQRLIEMMTSEDQSVPATKDKTVAKAYPNEHAARQLDPSKYKVVGSKQLVEGIRAIFALVDGKSVIQSFRFDSGKYTADAAKAWLKAHNYSTAQFEAAVAKDDIAIEADILKADNEEQTITYVVYPAKPLPWHDTQMDHMSESEIRKTCHRYMEQSQRFDLHHTEFNLSKQDISVVQNWQSPIAFAWPLSDGSTKQINAGDWIQTAHISNSDLWQRVKKGEFRAPSIRGKGKRTPIVAKG